MDNDQEQQAGADLERREAMFTMGKIMAYVPPVVATFAMGGLSIREAHAYGENSEGIPGG
jgi:hypothetical protein